MASKRTPIADGLNHLRELRSKIGPAIAVSYSGGKDSICVLWLCTRVFERVEAFYVAQVPGIECIEGPMRETARRLGVEHVHVFPDTFNLRAGLYRPQALTYLPRQDMTEWYDAARDQLDCPWIANGWRADDSMDRRIVIKADGVLNKRMRVAMPIAHWKTAEVYDLMRHVNAVTPPKVGGQRSSGFGLNADWMVFLHDRHPADYQRVLELHPFVDAIVYRAKKWGVGYLEARKNVGLVSEEGFVDDGEEEEREREQAERADDDSSE